MTGFLASTVRLPMPRLRRAVSCLAFLGGEVDDEWSDERVMLALTRKRWEFDDDFSAGVGIFVHRHLVVAADASIYDRATLLAALVSAGVRPNGSTPSHLIAAAYRAWDVRLANHLNGDFAFALWDSRRRRLIAGRDHTGLRPLFFADLGADAVVGSSARAVAEAAGRAGTINLAALGAQVAGLPWSAGSDTAYDGVDVVPPSHMLIVGDGRVRLERYWRPPIAPSRAPIGVEEARVTLRELLATAVSDRVGAGRSTVWMSGGWDSTAVFAAGQHRLPALERSRLRPVSISYPPNDPGCEDELIEAAAGFWAAKIQWLHSADIPLLDALEQRAREADEPPAHLYELWNRALARATRATGSRIALDGGGGDQLFQVSDVILADLLRTGSCLEAIRHARARDRGWRHAVRYGVLPLAPPALLELVARLAGARLPRHYLERDVAPWMRADFVARHELRERDLYLLQQARGPSLAHDESVLFLTLPIWGWGAAYMRGPLLQEGVEHRSPLLDRRVVEFALSRPVVERASARETKTLLRGAMQGLLPARLLDRRPYRTGTTIGFSRTRMREAYPALVERLFAQPLRLAEVGMIEPDVLRTVAERACAGQVNDFLRVNLFHAMKVEFWLRGLETRGASTTSNAPAERVDTNPRQIVANCAGQSPANHDRSMYVPET